MRIRLLHTIAWGSVKARIAVVTDSFPFQRAEVLTREKCTRLLDDCLAESVCALRRALAMTDVLFWTCQMALDPAVFAPRCSEVAFESYLSLEFSERSLMYSSTGRILLISGMPPTIIQVHTSVVVWPHIGAATRSLRFARAAAQGW